MSGDLWPYVLLLLVGFLPNEIWRLIGIVLARGLDETAPVVVWVRAVATAVLGGVIARIVLVPPGALASVPMAVRLAALAAGFAGYLLVRRSPFAGILIGEAALLTGAALFGS
ncbi:MAG TPA: AzlD domain-containing protein [Xanthobacteraceae bacterium]|nr:AzlD domain-containing protein [Xanthobacteraceae bacterium]